MPKKQRVHKGYWRVRSANVESQKSAVSMRNVGLDTRIKPSNVEKAKKKIKNRGRFVHLCKSHVSLVFRQP